MSSVGFAQGTYTGNGTEQFISLGWAPTVVFLKEDSATNSYAMIRASNLSAAYLCTSSGSTDAGIKSLDGLGFTVQKLATPVANTNENGATYYYWAWGGSNVAVGNYTGTGLAHGITGVGFQPVIAMAFGLTGANAIEYRSTSMAATKSMNFGLTNGKTTGITSLDADGFSVGTSTAINNNTSPYAYVCLVASDNFAEGTYVGNNTDNRNLPASALGWDPEFAHVKGDAGQLCYCKPNALTGDASFIYGQAASSTNKIQALAAASGTFQVGTDNAVNAYVSPGVITYYWFCFDAAAGPAPVAHRRRYGQVI